MGTICGEMRERLNRAVSKTVVVVSSTEGSNPSLSVTGASGNSGSASKSEGEAEIFESELWKTGEMTERPKVHAWKACVLLPGTEGSNPSLSDTPLVLKVRPYAIGTAPKPVRTGR